MDFDAYSSRLSSLHKYSDKQKPKKITQKSFQIINNNLQMITVNKTQFAGLNDKRFYFHDGITSLPFGHYLLEESRNEKEKYKKGIQSVIMKQKHNFLTKEAAAVRNCERLRLLRSIFSQPPLYYILNSKVLMKGQSFNKSTRVSILNSSWK